MKKEKYIQRQMDIAGLAVHTMILSDEYGYSTKESLHDFIGAMVNLANTHLNESFDDETCLLLGRLMLDESRLAVNSINQWHDFCKK